MSAFRFKQFQIEHQQSFKVGTDGVLLGAWANIEKDKNILEIGSGSGVISIMLAQRNYSAKITGIEIDPQSVTESKSNILQCPWHERIKVIKTDLQHFMTEQKFDHIITNPPFFSNSTKSKNKRKNETRHTETLSFDDIISFGQHYLQKNGTLSIILPKEEGTFFISQAIKKNFTLNRVTSVRSKINKPIERLLIEFIYLSTENRTIKEETLVIQNEQRNDYTEDYIKLTEAFYLIM